MVIIIVFALGSMFIGYKVYKLLNHKDRIEKVKLKKMNCRLQEADCSVDLDKERKISILIKKRPIKINEENQVTVKLNFKPKESLELDLFGVNYDMGYNRETLIKVGEKLFIGTFTLPTCVEKKMIWDFTLLIDDIGLKTQFEVIK